MPKQETLSPEQMEQFRTRLSSMRDRMSGEVDRVVDSVRAELDTSGNLSSVPVHMGDIAPEQLDADINVIENERDMLEEIQAAIHRIDEGTFGKCTNCGAAIQTERLQMIPYTPHCVQCAEKLGGGIEQKAARGFPGAER